MDTRANDLLLASTTVAAPALAKTARTSRWWFHTLNSSFTDQAVALVRKHRDGFCERKLGQARVVAVQSYERSSSPIFPAIVALFRQNKFFMVLVTPTYQTLYSSSCLPFDFLEAFIVLEV